MNLDLSKCSPEDVAKFLSTPKRVFEEINDAISGKFTDQDVRFDDPEHPVAGVNPVAYTRGDDWQQDVVETGSAATTNAPRSRHTGSKPWTSDGGGDTTPVTPVDELLNGLSSNNPGFEFFPIPREVCRQRKDAPWWIVDEQKFNDFIISQGKSKALDRAILYDYYMLGSQDEVIFSTYKAFFAKETGRQRRTGTSSAGAVKKRRQRLVKAGNAFHGAEPPKPISQPLKSPGPGKQRAFSGLVGRY